jgi:hypothetical protein
MGRNLRHVKPAAKHGVKIEPAFIPLFKATLQDLERTSKLRQEAKPIPSKEPSLAENDPVGSQNRIQSSN